MSRVGFTDRHGIARLASGDAGRQHGQHDRHAPRDGRQDEGRPLIPRAVVGHRMVGEFLRV